ncbi:MAG TPA: hypothetical protein VMU27_02600 [Candidatus Paceibacterota bacterium]|nr:hypothetical protein [Candidatus Paceibacterota bacterium]
MPWYDPTRTYEENYAEGPFGDLGFDCDNRGEPAYDFLGFKVNLPFGIPAGPLVNSRFIAAAFKSGFDINVYKTVRTRAKSANEWPNILPIDVQGDLTLEKAKKGLVVKREFTHPLAITNSFGNPSFPVDIWQKDIATLVASAQTRPGQLVLGMIEGTYWNSTDTEEDFVNDWVLAARLMQETGVHGIEANFSCPNEGDRVKRLLCFNTEKSQTIVDAMKNKIGNTPLVVKISYFENEQDLRDLVQKIGGLVDGISAINTIPAPVYKENGTQALPGGPWRLKSGICGAPIKWAGLDMVRRLKKLREEFGMKFFITGVGGVMSAADYDEYRNAGADAVMSATGAMWNAHLAQEIKSRHS